MAPAPWEIVPRHETLFVLVTGASSGIGLGIGQRLISEYLATRSLSAHLVLIPTARNVKKSNETVYALRQHAKEVALTSTTLRARAGPSYDPRQTTRRIHILSVQLDLCNFLTVQQAADQLVNGTLSGPPNEGGADDDADFFEPLVDVHIPRLDSVILNAGIGGWTGIDWPKVVHNILTRGIVQATTWPTFKAATPGYLINPLPAKKNADQRDAKVPVPQSRPQPQPRVGEVFCANVFGHYLFVHAVTPLLWRDSDPLPPGRIIWESSIEPVWDSLSLDDFQGIKTDAAYESSKRVTDLLALTSSLPAAWPFVSSWLKPDKKANPTAAAATNPPKVYVVHPGVVQTTMFPLNAFLFFWYRVVLYLSRFLGSPWHPITAYKGACAPVWLALQEQGALDAVGAERIKYGSSTTWAGEDRVKMSEVEGWGWDGRVADPNVAVSKDRDTRLLGKTTGRKHGATELSEGKRAEFEALGVACWRKMDELRKEWEVRIQKSTSN
ncbi:hypothetical protein B0T26DRAFT_722552 [Lasiosphaeria miniovina]|uniref:3-keto-steroid reductase n=1 Tax=Lasiosphaeria miniovina TaxID=1954250 RepID=A0AA40DQG1_9PEZI|nr:uncharacterized protein B0T26DRAFT_722552 [Lasiosphaeria miniovina]KAK0709686.1 hypothetical protein B0T26DRAFT_722552 [Lasiosphaeria miniovina]